MSLKDYNWLISYSSNANNPIIDFYIPALERSIQYDRRSGFFNSAILSKVASGLGAMLKNDGKIRLIMGCQFSSDDLQAVQQGYDLRQTLLNRLDNDLTPPINLIQLKHFQILSWLIANQYLDIKIAIPWSEENLPIPSDRLIEPRYIFHEKVGIFTDSQGNQIAFSGSNNESLGGWSNNVESFHVYCSWENPREQERVQEEINRFEQLWYNLAPNVKIFEIPEAIKHKLLQYTPSEKPTWSPKQEFDNKPIPPDYIINQPPQPIISPDIAPEPPLNLTIETEKPLPLSPAEKEQEIKNLRPLLEINQSPGCLDYCLKSIPINPWPHQTKILKRIATKFPCNILIGDEVGLGKTIETGLVLRYLLVAKKIKRVLILSPASVQSQWHSELREKFNLHFWSYGQKQFIPADETVKKFHDLPINADNNPWNTHNLILASSHLVRRKEQMPALLSSEPWDLIILDEAHHARRHSPQQRKDNPNRLLQLMQQLRQKTQAIILLSATPMQIDVVEIFDLLQILGLTGHWNYSDNFSDYFSFLSADINAQTLNFWQTMSTDYFRENQPCPRFDQLLQKSDRLTYSQITDVWQKGKNIINPAKYLNNKLFIATTRQYLTVNTPLKDLMFRHTRETLRSYYKHNIIDKDIPRRQVTDNAIALEKNREVPLYQAVSDYVRHFYNLALREKRQALGFIMTLYRRRLTSSFFAIQESLKRRLEGMELTEDDYADFDDADDNLIDGLEKYFRPIDSQEIQYLKDLLQQFNNTGEDSKLSHFISILRSELNERECAIVFTQYTDTMDYLRASLQSLYGQQLGCYSGRGGEIYLNGTWSKIKKEQIKDKFWQGEIKVLLCTDSAAEGLNFQNCGVLVNYDLPWNPMRVEQRIGRLDRIGQKYNNIRIHNFYYDGTVEAKVYSKLRDRINAFETVVGNLQPILAQVPNFIEQAVMSADPEEEGVLFGEFEAILATPPLKPALEEMLEMDVEADLEEIRQPITPTTMTPQKIATLFTTSKLLNSLGVFFTEITPDIWDLNYQGDHYQVTFNPKVFDKNLSSVQYMSLGNPLFERILELIRQC